LKPVVYLASTGNAAETFLTETLKTPIPQIHFQPQNDRGMFTCHDARTGREIYGKQRIDPDASAFTASPWASNGKIFALSEDGDTYVIQSGAEFKVLGKNPLGEMCMATPAIARGSLVIRTATKLYRIGKDQ
jgi:hypothetical protein